MIIGKDALLERIKNYSFEKESNLSYKEKIRLFEKAINDSIKKILKEILNDTSEVHLAYSGGVDSSLMLVKILQYLKQNHSLIAHTAVSNKIHADFYHSKKFVNELKKTYSNLRHEISIVDFSDDDTKESNKILKVDDNAPDENYMFLKPIKAYTNKLIVCACIDELLHGYRLPDDTEEDETEKDKKKEEIYNMLPFIVNIPGGKDIENIDDILEMKDDLNQPDLFYTFLKNMGISKKREESNSPFRIKDEIKALKEHMSDLPYHLSKLDKFSSLFNINIFLPYGTEKVMNATSNFSVNEMLHNGRGKKPIYEFAKKNGVSDEILRREKIGLASSFFIYFRTQNES